MFPSCTPAQASPRAPPPGSPGDSSPCGNEGAGGGGREWTADPPNRAGRAWRGRHKARQGRPCRSRAQVGAHGLAAGLPSTPPACLCLEADGALHRAVTLQHADGLRRHLTRERLSGWTARTPPTKQTRKRHRTHADAKPRRARRRTFIGLDRRAPPTWPSTNRRPRSARSPATGRPRGPVTDRGRSQGAA